AQRQTFRTRFYTEALTGSRICQLLALVHVLSGCCRLIFLMLFPLNQPAKHEAEHTCAQSRLKAEQKALGLASRRLHDRRSPGFVIRVDFRDRFLRRAVSASEF